jgi:tRNA(Ile)-lysidine synthase
LLALEEISELLDLTLYAAHMNHRLRGHESDKDELFVTGLCERFQIPLETRKLKPAQLKVSQNLENAARQKRYSFLAEIADRESAVLATGHNRNDQAETFLMKLFRGAGPSGLSGIFIKRQHRLGSTSVPVVRPLLEITRKEITDYLEFRGELFREDSTNSMLDYDRNWVRHHLMPTLESRFTPQVSKTLARNAALFSEIETYLDSAAEEVLDELGTDSGEDFLIDLPGFTEAPRILRMQMARTALRRVKGDLLDLTQSHIRKMLDLCKRTSGKQLQLPGSLRVVREFNNLRISLSGEDVSPFEHILQLPGKLEIPEIGKRVCASKVPVSNKGEQNLISTRIKMVTVRNRRPGDRYLLSSKSQKKNLKRLFLEKRVPISQRDRLVMLEYEGRVIWIEGFPVDPTAKTGERDLEGMEIDVISETFPSRKPSK